MKSNVIKNRYPVPTNIYKRKSTPFGNFPYKVPSPQEIVHPFYKPNDVASLTLCMRETKPRLLDGQFIMPTVLKHPKTQKYNLVDGALKFSTVKGVNTWLKSYLDHMTKKTEKPELIPVSERYNMQSHRKLSKEAKGAILLEFQEKTANGRVMIDRSKIIEVIEKLTINLELGLFSEDILIFALNNISKSPREVSVILSTATELLDTRIDQIKSVGNIISACITKLETMDVVETAIFLPEINKFLMKVCKKFHISSVFQRLNPVVNEKLFQFFVQHKNVEDATFAINELINKNVKPEDKEIIEYFKLLEQKFPDVPSNNKHKIAYINNFSPLITNTNEPTIFGFLIRSCSHNDILGNVIQLIDKNQSAKKILIAVNSQITLKIRQLSKHEIEASYRLCDYLQTLNKHFPDQLPPEISWELFLSFFQDGNFIMASKIIDENKIVLNPVLVNDLLSKNKKLRIRSMEMNSIGFTHNALSEFIDKYFLPHANVLTNDNKEWFNLLKK